MASSYEYQVSYNLLQMMHSCKKKQEEKSEGKKEAHQMCDPPLFCAFVCLSSCIQRLCVGVRGYFGSIRGIQASERLSSYNRII